jgi:hypothetical protein
MQTWVTSKRVAAFWRGTYVRKVLINPAAAGTLVMRRTGEDEKTRARRDKVEATIKEFYPAAVSEELFERLRNAGRPLLHEAATVPLQPHVNRRRTKPLELTQAIP